MRKTDYTVEEEILLSLLKKYKEKGVKEIPVALVEMVIKAQI